MPCPRTPSRKQLIEDWLVSSKVALVDPVALTTFPVPPAWPCPGKECRRSARSLAACSCNIREAFRHLDGYPRSLKTERLKWHPDKFSRCSEDKVAKWKDMAKEVFVVVNEMWEKSCNSADD